MSSLIAAAAVFLLIHLLVSGTQVRDRIVKVTGEGPYLGLFSLVSIAALTWMAFAFGKARSDPANVSYWTISHATRDPAIVLVLIGFLFAVPGLLTNSPTRVSGGAIVDKPDAAKGMTRVTRHPFLWGAAIWALGHIIANGRTADLILFGTILVLALMGTASIDGKRQRALGERYTVFKTKTSNIPFVAIAQGRQSFSLREIWWRLAVGLVLWGVVLYFHPKWFGVNPLG
ncbi:MAG: NnrU family protein [Caulobacteraceae bacterium]|nr:NnrU family protein [Caulobacteraceae bacterium]